MMNMILNNWNTLLAHIDMKVYPIGNVKIDLFMNTWDSEAVFFSSFYLFWQLAYFELKYWRVSKKFPLLKNHWSTLEFMCQLSISHSRSRFFQSNFSVGNSNSVQLFILPHPRLYHHYRILSYELFILTIFPLNLIWFFANGYMNEKKKPNQFFFTFYKMCHTFSTEEKWNR